MIPSISSKELPENRLGDKWFYYDKPKFKPFDASENNMKFTENGKSFLDEWKSNYRLGYISHINQKGKHNGKINNNQI